MIALPLPLLWPHICLQQFQEAGYGVLPVLLGMLLEIVFLLFPRTMMIEFPEKQTGCFLNPIVICPTSPLLLVNVWSFFQTGHLSLGA